VRQGIPDGEGLGSSETTIVAKLNLTGCPKQQVEEDLTSFLQIPKNPWGTQCLGRKKESIAKAGLGRTQGVSSALRIRRTRLEL
jgi:hypothetical protein